MLRKQFLILVLLFTATISFAQSLGSVKGTVKDSTGNAIDFVSVVVSEDQKYYTNTDKNGAFTLPVPADKKVTLIFSSINTITYKKEVTVKAGETIIVSPVVSYKPNVIPQVDIQVHRTITPEPSMVQMKPQQLDPSITGDIAETVLHQSLGVQKNNELTTNYSVRGGNYDENLVYVNDFEVYRPFLIRSGQQEGLSFVNPDMAGNVKFSSGGFQSKYGDKMSSVLDVTYRRPDSLRGSFYASLLGLGGHLEWADKKQRFTFSVGVRQRLSQYVLKSLDTKGEYSPNFLDVQGYLSYRVSKKVQIDYIVNYSRNQFTFLPVDRETSFGLLTDVKKLTIYFDGQEADKYHSLMNGLSLTHTVKDNLTIKWLVSYYQNREKEAYDLLGEYYLSQVESDLSKSNFGQILYSLGVGGLQNWARNTLNSDVYYAGTKGSWFKNKHNLQWGVDYKHEVISSKISEWNILDSAGYSMPHNGIDVNVNSLLRSEVNLNSNRISAYIQDTWKVGDTSTNRFSLTYGLRYQYWDLNKEVLVNVKGKPALPLIQPRIQATLKPKGRADIVLTAALGAYYQPAFYREMQNSYTGEVNTSLRSQKSIHAILGLDYAFKAWKRNFSFITEVYYKYLWDLVPYQYEDVQIKYLGINDAKGYAAGIDMRLNGEIVQGAESWIGLSIMGTGQNIADDKYTAYYDSTGKQIASNSQTRGQIKDSTVVHPGTFARPTDQRVNFTLFFQDYIPKFKFIKIHVAMVFGTGLPFGPPGTNFYQSEGLRIPPYRRVDIGFSGQLWNPDWAKQRNKFNQGLKGVWLSLEVFNIFGITNTVSYLWIRDINNTQYAVPNYLTSRRINAKLVVNF